MLNLLNLWENTLHQHANIGSVRDYQNITKTSSDFDRDTQQSSFELKKSPKVIFVKNITTLEYANFYDDLPKITLSEEDETLRLNYVKEQKIRNAKFYDGLQMLITDVLYDESSNTIYMAALRTPYSFIMMLSNKIFPETSHWYQTNFFKTGVLAPLITRNGATVLQERVKSGLYSVPGGFLEPEKDKKLNFEDRNKDEDGDKATNLVINTARNEIIEEVAGVSVKGIVEPCFEFRNTQISAISIRKTARNPIGTIEFIAPSYADCHSDYLQSVIREHLAKDAFEHTTQQRLIPLDSQDRNELLQKLTIPGKALYLPVLLSLTRLENNMLPDFISTQENTSIAWTLSFFIAKPQKPLPCRDQKELEVRIKI